MEKRQQKIFTRHWKMSGKFTLNLANFHSCHLLIVIKPKPGLLVLVQQRKDNTHARRHEDAKLLDEASYTRYEKMHGIKTMNIVFPNGIIPWVYGPVSVRENDLGVMNLSDLDQ
eukprot:scaffold260423_cov68-Attheya_sp.AAC.1